jgi:addiction module RelE/StbE family toxin
MAKDLNIRYLSTAEKDLLEIFDYIARDSQNAAGRLLDEIDKKVTNLSKHPEIGKIPQDSILKSKGYRYLIIGNYLVFYRVKDKIIVIHRVLHSKREYRDIL